jgi:hypothetical protein
MTVKTGYKLVCEWCDKESDPLFTSQNPENERRQYNESLSMFAQDRFGIFHFPGWIKDTVSFTASTWKYRSYLFFQKEQVEVKTTKFKNVFFCCEKHHNRWKKCRDASLQK